MVRWNAFTHAEQLQCLRAIELGSQPRSGFLLQGFVCSIPGQTIGDKSDPQVWQRLGTAEPSDIRAIKCCTWNGNAFRLIIESEPSDEQVEEATASV